MGRNRFTRRCPATVVLWTRILESTVCKTVLRSNGLMRTYIRTAYALVLTLACRTKISHEVNNKLL